jgi:hypothetical protein
MHKHFSWLRGEDREFQAPWFWHRDIASGVSPPLDGHCTEARSLRLLRTRSRCRRPGEQHGEFMDSPRAATHPLPSLHVQS